MKAGTLLANVSARDVRVPEDLEVTGVAFDSRKVQPGNLFVCLSGGRFDGHDFIADVLKRGAVVIVGTDEKALAAAPYRVLVDDTRDALADLAASFYGHPGRALRLVGVTGTNGKTTFTYVLEAALAGCGRKSGVIGTVDARFCDVRENLGLTTPEAPVLNGLLARMRDAGVDVAAAEISSHGIVLKRARGLDFSVGVFTNLSQDHLDFHKDLDEYGRVKESFFTQLLPAGEGLVGAVVNADDRLGAHLADVLDYRVLTYAVEGKGDIRAENLETTLEGLSFAARGPWGDLPVRSRLVGRHNASNILAALGTVHLLGDDVAAAIAGIEKLLGVPGRLETVENRFGMGIWVDYCHTPDALEKVLLALREAVPGKLITVFGAGGDRDRTKRPQMAEVVERFSDTAVVTSDNPRTEEPLAIIDEIVAGFTPDFRREQMLVCADREQAIAAALGLAGRGDGVLIGGKGHETYQIVGTQVRHFDDREVARAVLARLEASRG